MPITIGSVSVEEYIQRLDSAAAKTESNFEQVSQSGEADSVLVSSEAIADTSLPLAAAETELMVETNADELRLVEQAHQKFLELEESSGFAESGIVLASEPSLSAQELLDNADKAKTLLLNLGTLLEPNQAVVLMCNGEGCYRGENGDVAVDLKQSESELNEFAANILPDNKERQVAFLYLQQMNEMEFPHLTITIDEMEKLFAREVRYYCEVASNALRVLNLSETVTGKRKVILGRWLGEGNKVISSRKDDQGAILLNLYEGEEVLTDSVMKLEAEKEPESMELGTPEKLRDFRKEILVRKLSLAFNGRFDRNVKVVLQNEIANAEAFNERFDNIDQLVNLLVEMSFQLNASGVQLDRIVFDSELAGLGVGYESFQKLDGTKERRIIAIGIPLKTEMQPERLRTFLESKCQGVDTAEFDGNMEERKTALESSLQKIIIDWENIPTALYREQNNFNFFELAVKHADAELQKYKPQGVTYELRVTSDQSSIDEQNEVVYINYLTPKLDITWGLASKEIALDEEKLERMDAIRETLMLAPRSIQDTLRKLNIAEDRRRRMVQGGEIVSASVKETLADAAAVLSEVDTEADLTDEECEQLYVRISPAITILLDMGVSLKAPEAQVQHVQDNVETAESLTEIETIEKEIIRIKLEIAEIEQKLLNIPEQVKRAEFFWANIERLIEKRYPEKNSGSPDAQNQGVAWSELADDAVLELPINGVRTKKAVDNARLSYINNIEMYEGLRQEYEDSLAKLRSDLQFNEELKSAILRGDLGNS